MIKADLLLEIGTEELPPEELEKLATSLARDLYKALVEARFLVDDDGQPISYAAPRRLAVLIPSVCTKQTASIIERRGPALSAAFSTTGDPTPATLGFARSCQVAVTDLIQLTTDRGVFLGYRQRQPGGSLKANLPQILENVLKKIPMGRRMRWGTGQTEFVRPVHWVVLLHGTRVIRTPILGVISGRKTRGHRFHAPISINLTQAKTYTDQLKSHGFVEPHFATRRQLILKQIQTIAQQVAAVPLVDTGLLDLVTALVEWPQAIMGSFDPAFLTLPPEVLIAAMQGHQKYFPVVDAHGRLMPRFITVANIESTDVTKVRKGNERVLAARFADARFFWEKDREQSLETHARGLSEVAFEQRLGSLADKAHRLTITASKIALCLSDQADTIKLDTKNSFISDAQSAARLCKADLLTGMVGEFPELQGIMGGYYARHEGLNEAISEAISEHYRPRFSGDPLPKSLLGKIIALTDKLDTLVGIYGIGLIPTGDKDPFGLRRAAIGILRLLIAIEEEQPPRYLNLSEILGLARDSYDKARFPNDFLEPLKEFLIERLRHLLTATYPIDAIDAGLTGKTERIGDAIRRIAALSEFTKTPEAAALIGADKRIRNILKQAPTEITKNIDLILKESAEIDLAHALADIQPRVKTAVSQGLYGEALTDLRSLREPIDGFFNTVLVMTHEPDLRLSRLQLLAQLSALFATVGDVSRLRIAGDINV